MTTKLPHTPRQREALLLAVEAKLALDDAKDDYVRAVQSALATGLPVREVGKELGLSHTAIHSTRYRRVPKRTLK